MLRNIASTLGALTADGEKKLRYARSFVTRRLVHTNLQITYHCNFRCEICDFWKKENRGRPVLSVDDVRVIADKLAEVGPQIVSIGGGEPLLHPDIEEIVAVLAEKHFPVMICNGWYVTPEKARALFDAGIYEVSVSVDYADAAPHDAQRGVEGAWEQAIEALRVLEANRTKSWQRVHMISVVMQDNVDHIERLIELSSEMGITYLVTLYSDARGLTGKRPDMAVLSKRLLDLKKRHKDFVQLRGYLARFTEAVTEGGIGPCYAGKNLCNIDSSGNVALCIDHLEDSVGNILEEDMTAIERKLLEKHESNPCHTCWTSCRGAIETLMYNRAPVSSLVDYYQMTKPLPLSS